MARENLQVVKLIFIIKNKTHIDDIQCKKSAQHDNLI